MTRREIEGIAKVIRNLPEERIRRESVAVLIGTEIINRANKTAWDKWLKACDAEPRGKI